jgi:two-component system sensor histidine kinase SenX3
VRALAESRKVTIDVTAFPRTIISCERRTMAMAIRNLLENAVRYSPENSRVTVSARRVKDAVELSVKDQGIGIDPVDLPRIFDRFYRADEARDRETGGTGIGLAIVKHVARQHGGRVQVWSEPSVGSTFTLVLPFVPPSRP